MWILNATTYKLSAVPPKAPLSQPSRTRVLIPATSERRSKLCDDQDGNTSRQIRACKFAFHMSCIYRQGQFPIYTVDKFTDSVNLREAHDAGHVVRLYAVSKCTAKGTVRK